MMSEHRGEFHYHLSRLPGKRVLATIALIIVISSGVVIIGQLPVHRTSVEHSDMKGDVSDASIDIVQIRSYLDGSDIVLRMTVTGRIMDDTSSVRYEYRLIVVARGLIDNRSHIYTCYYANSTTWPYPLQAFFENDTLRILFPIAVFVSDSYMIGLEGLASIMGNNGIERDYTSEDRNGTVAKLLF